MPDFKWRRTVPGDGQVLVRVKAAGINPSEAVIRTIPQIDQIWVR